MGSDLQAAAAPCAKTKRRCTGYVQSANTTAAQASLATTTETPSFTVTSFIATAMSSAATTATKSKRKICPRLMGERSRNATYLLSTKLVAAPASDATNVATGRDT